MHYYYIIYINKNIYFFLYPSGCGYIILYYYRLFYQSNEIRNKIKSVGIAKFFFNLL